jgi:diguanylate cyclase (GGDEF)-like protein/PAS domain S-box-containing protein
MLGRDGLGRGFEEAAAGMTLVDEAQRFRWVNVAFCAMVGRSAGTLLGLGVRDVMHADHVARATAFYDGLLRGGAGAVHDRFRYRRPDDTPVWAEVGGTLMPEGPRLVLVQQLDVTAAQLMADALAHRAMHDDLTGLANRALLRDRLRGVLARARRSGGHAVVFYLDVDRFKDVNDDHGHTAGDAVLCEVAARLTGAVRSGDTVARVGGDEFVVAGEVRGPAEATHLAERIGSALRPPICWGPRVLMVSSSMGVAMSTDADQPDDLVARADRSLLSTKRARPARSRAGP